MGYPPEAAQSVAWAGDVNTADGSFVEYPDGLKVAFVSADEPLNSEYVALALNPGSRSDWVNPAARTRRTPARSGPPPAAGSTAMS